VTRLEEAYRARGTPLADHALALARARALLAAGAIERLLDAPPMTHTWIAAVAAAAAGGPRRIEFARLARGRAERVNSGPIRRQLLADLDWLDRDGLGAGVLWLDPIDPGATTGVTCERGTGVRVACHGLVAKRWPTWRNDPPPGTVLDVEGAPEPISQVTGPAGRATGYTDEPIQCVQAWVGRQMLAGALDGTAVHLVQESGPLGLSMDLAGVARGPEWGDDRRTTARLLAHDGLVLIELRRD
jgi:hypothetical protein